MSVADAAPAGGTDVAVRNMTGVADAHERTDCLIQDPVHVGNRIRAGTRYEFVDGAERLRPLTLDLRRQQFLVRCRVERPRRPDREATSMPTGPP